MNLSDETLILPSLEDFFPCTHCDYRNTAVCESCQKPNEYIEAEEIAEYTQSNKIRENEYYEERFRKRGKLQEYADPLTVNPLAKLLNGEEGELSEANEQGKNEPWYAHLFPEWKQFEWLRKIDLTLFPVPRWRAVFFYCQLFHCKKKEVAKTLSVTPKTISQDLREIQEILNEQEGKRKTRGRPLRLGPIGFHKKNLYLLERCEIDRVKLIQKLRRPLAPPVSAEQVQPCLDAYTWRHARFGDIETKDSYLLKGYEHPALVKRYEEFIKFLEWCEETLRPSPQRYLEMAVGTPVNRLHKRQYRRIKPRNSFKANKTLILR